MFSYKGWVKITLHTMDKSQFEFQPVSLIVMSYTCTLYHHVLFNCYCFSWVDQYPLHSAAYEGNADKVRHLLSMGYPADQPDMHSWVPLHYASWWVQKFYSHPVIHINSWLLPQRKRTLFSGVRKKMVYLFIVQNNKQTNVFCKTLTSQFCTICAYLTLMKYSHFKYNLSVC